MSSDPLDKHKSIVLRAIPGLLGRRHHSAEQEFWARIDASHIVNIAVVRSSGLDERSMRSARPVTGSTAEAIPDRCGWG